MLQRLRTDATVRRGQWVALADVSPALRTLCGRFRPRGRFSSWGGQAMKRHTEARLEDALVDGLVDDDFCKLALLIE